MTTHDNFTPIAMALLDSFVKQRPGFEPGNYSDASSYRSEMRSVTKDRHHYERIASSVRWRSFTTAQWQQAFRDGFSGRLTLTERRGGKALEYCTGQYFCTEYRKAACAVLASLLWADARENMPAPTGKVTRTSGFGPFRHTTEHDSIEGKAPGDWMRSKFRKQFGRTIAKGYFS